MILVTGAAGFIGSVMVRELNRQGRQDLIVVDTASDATACKNLEGCHFKKYIEAYQLLKELDQVLDQVTQIVHLGACSSTTERDVHYLNRNNLEYSIKLFEAAARRNIPMIYASSAATYGNGEQGYSDDHAMIDKLHPLNPYAHSKHHFDQWVLRQENVPPVWFGLKFFNVFGPFEYHKGHMRSLVHKAFEQIHESGKVILFKSHRPDFKDGYQLRDFIYVMDCARAMLLMMQVKDAKASAIYNLGTGVARPFYDLVAAVFNTLEKKINIEYIDMPEDIRGQYQYFTQAEMQKFKRQFPKFQFSQIEDGVRDYVLNYLKH